MSSSIVVVAASKIEPGPHLAGARVALVVSGKYALWACARRSVYFCDRAMSASEPPKMFHVRQPVNETFNAGLAGAGVGLLASAVQNSLQKHKAGAMGIFTRTGGTIALCST